ncbi:MAG TPA: hypothetical protein VGV18_00130 [Verrucomicrobiae bacterium]|nr:hypothetical protein [Verrucomicrobiae bacterium]
MNHETKIAGAKNKIRQQHGRGGGGVLSFRLLAFGVVLVSGILAGYWTLAQSTPPVLTITPLGTNQYSISITNNIGMTTYDLQWTPVLANANYPWTWAAPGTAGQTNYLVNMNGVSDTGFFRTLLDTNAIPLWEAADPNNPALGILTVTIDSPANGSVIQ